MSRLPVRTITKREELLSFVETVKRNADSDRTAFSFSPEKFYQEAAISEKLIVAAKLDGNTCVGHLIFGGVFPNGRVFQIYVDPLYRKQGVSIALFERLFVILNNRQFTQVQARVAADLVDANSSYEHIGFRTRKVVDGKTVGRKINIRVKELNAPTLFTYVPKLKIASDLSLPERSTTRAATFVIDLNVIFDAVKDRLNTEAAGTIMRAAFKNYIRIAISRELKNELERTALETTTDPMLKMASYIWTFEIPLKARVKEVSKKLAPIVFPERHSQGILTALDESDLIHLVTAVDNQAAGFVTSEKKILAASEFLRSEFGLEVISLSELEQLVDDDSNSSFDMNDLEAFSDDCLSHRASKLNDPLVQKAIQTLNIDARFLPAVTLPASEELIFMVVTDKKQQPIGFAWWTSHLGPTPTNDAFITANEASPDFEGTIDFLCDKIIKGSCIRDVCLVKLLSDEKQMKVREILLEHGFKASSGKHHEESSLQKICVGYPIHRENWNHVRLKISNASGGISLPKDLSPESAKGDTIEFQGHDGTSRYITLRDLELLLSPTLLITGDRDGAIVPINRSWADDLFGSHEQGGLFAPPEAIARRERVYFSQQSTLATLTPGRVILFYESGGDALGHMAIIAIGRVTQSSIVIVDEVEENLLRRGVIDKRTLQSVSGTGKQTVTFFDNIMTLKKPVPYTRLKELGCDNSLNFVTATPISPKHLATILIEGQAHV